MNTIIVNGSPNAKNGNTQIFIREFSAGAGAEYPVYYSAREPAAQLATTISQADTVLFFMPLYVHAMPGGLMKLFEKMSSAREGQKMGFVVQAGFVEGAQARFLVRYLNAFAKRLGYENLGVVTRGDAAGTSFMPDFLNKKLFSLLRTLGQYYAAKGCFDSDTARQLAGVYELTPGKARFYEFMHRSGINHTFWHKFWKENGVYKQGLDRPFAPGAEM